ncbi:MAG: acyl-CoA dehydrogenase, partial [Gemmatimonadales bacterium]|nr:acyl-CoA dehydrogenase [Gemmatimonadales bacterium]
MDTRTQTAGAGDDSRDAQRATLAAAVAAARAYLDAARTSVLGIVGEGGKVRGARIDANQRAVHGRAWTATYVQAITELAGWYDRLAARGRLGEIERHIALIGVGEYLSQIVGGIPMSQLEFARPADLGADAALAQL